MTMIESDKRVTCHVAIAAVLWQGKGAAHCEVAQHGKETGVFNFLQQGIKLEQCKTGKV